MMPKRHKVKEDEINGLRLFQPMVKLLRRVHYAGCERDKAGNRKLHMDEYMLLLLLYMFNPIVVSLRSIQQVSTLRKVQRMLGCPRTSLGSLSEATMVFDHSLLAEIVGELADQVKAIPRDARLGDLKQTLTVVDGSVLPALPKIAWALFRGDGHKAAKLHVQFEVLKGVPVDAEITSANESEKTVLSRNLKPSRLYVIDRGYAKYGLYQEILDSGSSFVGRLRDNSVYEVMEERSLTEADRAEGVVRCVVARLGVKQKRDDLEVPVLIVEVRCTPHRKRSKTGRGGPEQGERMLLCTDRLDFDAEVVSLIYRRRWAVEIFFRFFKHVLGCRHLLSHSPEGITLQTYAAILACLRIALWTNRKPPLRTHEMICYYLMGWAEEDELLSHINRLKKFDI
jgi:hypothetical protein